MPNNLKFPKDFLWGTATSAHQTEGNNTNSDWWHWEQTKEDRKYPLEASGVACDSYNRYEEDFKLCNQLNNNAVRISVEWARLEPNPGEFSKKEFDHYRKVLKNARQNGLKTFVTLHHFTNPSWFANKGGWLNRKSPYYFSRYAQQCAKEFGNLVDVYLTINEPQVVTLMGYVKGTWPPNKANYFKSLVVQINFMRAHVQAYNYIKRVNANFTVGIVKHIVWYEKAYNKFDLIDKLTVGILNFLGRGFFLQPIKNYIDVLGVNYYITKKIHRFKTHNPPGFLSDLDWWVNPKGLSIILNKVSNYNIPIYITENGIAAKDDKKRIKFIKQMLGVIAESINEGVNVKGYFHWSLLDNYEWHDGYWPKFGLVKVDSKTQKRTPKKSYYYYAKICSKNSI